MPTAPPRRCPNMGCPHVNPCPVHAARKGWQGSTRKQRLPPDWPQRRAAVLSRDGGRCQCPGCPRCTPPCTTPATDVDHVRPGDDHTLANLQALCATCHATKTGQQANSAKKQRRY